MLIHKKETFEAQARIETIGSPKPVEDSTSSDEKFLINITQIIEDHMADSNLNVNGLCELSGTGSKQIYRKIKQLTGMSPVEYIKSIRMKRRLCCCNRKIHHSGSYVYGGIFQPFLFLEMLPECFRKDSETIYIGHRTVM